MYALVVFMAADCAPEPAVMCYAQTTSVNRFLLWLDQIPFVGGAGEGSSHIAEGLSTAIQVFDDFQSQREPNLTTQKHCILICNSPPYPLACVESQNYSGYMADQLASLMGERGINLTIISPRKIPALLKLYDKAGGDLQVMQTKNYAKDRRHLILLRGFQLQERPVSPSALEQKPKPPPDIKPPLNANSPAMAGNNLSVGSPQPGNKKRPPGGSPPNAPPYKQHINNPSGIIQATPTNTTVGQTVNSQQAMMQPPSTQRSLQNTMTTQGMGRPLNNAPSSTSFLNQPNPPNVTISHKGPLPGMDGTSGPMSMPRPNQVVSPLGIRGNWPNIGTGQAPGAMSHLLNQLNQPQLKGPPNAPGQIINRSIAPGNMVIQNQAPGGPPVVMLNQSTGVPTTGIPSQTSTLQNQLTMNNSMNMPGGQNNFSTQMTVGQPQQPPQTGPMTTMSQGGFQNQGINPQGLAGPQVGNLPNSMQPQKERRNIWTGMLEWQEKAKMMNDSSNKVTRTLPCQVMSHLGPTGETEVNADKWPKKLIMQLIPKQLVSSFGGLYLKNSRNVIFQFTPTSDVLDTLNKVMSTGFAGCVHFSNAQCDIRVMILLFSPEKRAYIGFIPNDQNGLVSAIRMAITSHKKQQVVKQQQIIQGGPAPTAPPNQRPPPTQAQLEQPQPQPPPPSIFTSAGNATQQSMPTLNSALTATSSAPVLGVPPQATQGGLLIAQATPSGGGTTTINMSGPQQSGPPPPQMSQLEAERAQNLLKIQQLQQTLEAAQQKERQYKVAQEQQAKSVMAVRQIQQHRMIQGQPGGNSNPQLRHLLQHQQSQQLRHQQMLLQQQQHRAQLAPNAQINPANMAATLVAQQQSMRNQGGGLYPDDSSFLDMQ